ncbi:MAG: hypothetical protein GPI99_07775 [Microcystis aeruginosa W13-15]|nr:hypothetical protein [Microcystis aeruginosa W13-16]NCQ73579.1 hypothetical protein [Microcystis aeruginosa W13-13]NCQ78057.1 hypothetical protein [Microcystis aeruginosa W13-15]
MNSGFRGNGSQTTGFSGDAELFPGSCRWVDILAAVKRTAIPHHATFLGWSRQRG